MPHAPQKLWLGGTGVPHRSQTRPVEGLPLGAREALTCTTFAGACAAGAEMWPADVLGAMRGLTVIERGGGGICPAEPSACGDGTVGRETGTPVCVGAAMGVKWRGDAIPLTWPGGCTGPVATRGVGCMIALDC